MNKTKEDYKNSKIKNCWKIDFFQREEKEEDDDEEEISHLMKNELRLLYGILSFQ